MGETIVFGTLWSNSTKVQYLASQLYRPMLFKLSILPRIPREYTTQNKGLYTPSDLTFSSVMDVCSGCTDIIMRQMWVQAYEDPVVCEK